VASALAEFRRHLGASQIASHRSFINLVEQLTPNERELLVKTMHQQLRQRRFPRPGRQHSDR
jgi:hypothetical protein